MVGLEMDIRSKFKRDIEDILVKRKEDGKCTLEIFDGNYDQLSNRIQSYTNYNKNNVIIVMGGDGTLQHVIDCIYKRRVKNGSYDCINIMIIPTGAGNDFYRSVGGVLDDDYS